MAKNHRNLDKMKAVADVPLAVTADKPIPGGSRTGKKTSLALIAIL
jgi:hypothetical protein